jgi:hypothetical protein
MGAGAGVSLPLLQENKTRQKERIKMIEDVFCCFIK